MATKRYKVIGESRLAFPDGQVANPGDEFDRDYEPAQELQHLMGGHIQEITPVRRMTKHVPVSKLTVKESSDE